LKRPSGAFFVCGKKRHASLREALAKPIECHDIPSCSGVGGNAMSAIRLAVTMVSTAVALSRHPAVRAGVQAVVANPKARETAINTTKNAAYNAGVIARHLLGRNKS
jgi:putative component of membrane protein insertase Oxa1/YidC/SpoIIIJ protein YidD